MSDPRYVIVDLADYSMMMPAKRTNLPDAEHIHVTRHPDRTITATPMQPFTKYQQRHERSLIEVMQPNEVWMNGTWLRVDSPGGAA